jgi:hypothetical protein
MAYILRSAGKAVTVAANLLAPTGSGVATGVGVMRRRSRSPKTPTRPRSFASKRR